jgi:hypothetical protein
MRKLRRRLSLLAAGIALLAGPAAWAQPGFDAAATARQWTDRMTKELSLAPDQSAKVGAANADFFETLQGTFERRKGADAAGRRALVDEVLQAVTDRETALRAILTPAQWEELKSHRIQNAASLQTKLLEMRLDLTAEQLPKVERINRDTAAAIEKLLAEDGRKTKLVRQIRSEGDRRDEALKRVLSSEQWKAYETHKEQMKEILKEHLKRGREAA